MPLVRLSSSYPHYICTVRAVCNPLHHHLPGKSRPGVSLVINHENCNECTHPLGLPTLI